MHKHEWLVMCHEHMHKYVRITMADGAVYEGVIEKVDDEHVYVACPIREEEGERYFPYPGYYPYHYGYHPRFRRFGLPLAGLIGLSLLPYAFI